MSSVVACLVHYAGCYRRWTNPAVTASISGIPLLTGQLCGVVVVPPANPCRALKWVKLDTCQRRLSNVHQTLSDAGRLAGYTAICPQACACWGAGRDARCTRDCPVANKIFFWPPYKSTPWLSEQKSVQNFLTYTRVYTVTFAFVINIDVVCYRNMAEGDTSAEWKPAAAGVW